MFSTSALSLVDALSHLAWVAGDDGRLVVVSEGFSEYAAQSADAFVGDGWLELVHPDERADVARAWRAAVASGAPFDATVRLLRGSDRSYRWHLGRATLAAGSALGDGKAAWFGTWTDIDGLKRGEASAAAAKRGTDDFLATLSHELRAPLHAILGWARELRFDLTTERRDRAIAAVERNAEAQARLIEDLLDVSRIIAGKLPIERKPVHLAKVVRAAAESIAPAFASRGVRFEVDVPEDVGVVLGDADRISQIATNLLSNALKFTPEGRAVRIELVRDENEATVTVQDEGVGIATSFLPHVFERFRQEDSSSARTRGGLGLGLAIVGHLVSQHGGSALAESEGEGKGATFTVSFPVLESGPEIVATEKPKKPRTDSNAPLRGIRVLVIDDEDDARELMLFALEQHGAVVTAVASASAARVALEKESVHVIVSDVGMPGEDGYEFIRDLRARPPYAGGSVPAIALTGYASLDDRRRAYAAGFDRHVSKPVDFAELARIIREVERTTA